MNDLNKNTYRYVCAARNSKGRIEERTLFLHYVIFAKLLFALTLLVVSIDVSIALDGLDGDDSLFSKQPICLAVSVVIF